jgi:hypothetical protein
MEQLYRINKQANQILERVTKWIEGDEEALAALAKRDDLKLRDPHDIALKAMAEIRGQLSTQLEMFKTLYSIQAVQEFQRVVLDAVNSVSPDLRDRIVAELNRQRLLR